jgi:hypothetical protein
MYLRKFKKLIVDWQMVIILSNIVRNIPILAPQCHTLFANTAHRCNPLSVKLALQLIHFTKEVRMQKTLQKCIDCGSEAIQTVIDEIKPIFRMEVVYFSCGAVFKSSYGARGQIGNVSQEGCRAENE